MINLRLGDCMEAMKLMPDKAYELAIVDPPYGIGAGLGTQINIVSKKDRNGDSHGTKVVCGDWDNSAPPKEYFTELFRVSINQIIWGGNYFELPPSQWVIWDKLNGDSFFADGEMAWTSFKTKMRIFKYLSCGFLGSHKNRDTRIHPTQKPVALYEWLLKNYAKPGARILDTHCGSGSILIACDIMGYSIDAWEIDKDYYEAAKERLERHQRQGKLFEVD